MRDLIVIGYPDAKAAEAARDALLALPREEIFRISDAVVAARDKKGAIKLSHIVRSGALEPRNGHDVGTAHRTAFSASDFRHSRGRRGGRRRRGLE